LAFGEKKTRLSVDERRAQGTFVIGGGGRGSVQRKLVEIHMRQWGNPRTLGSSGQNHEKRGGVGNN